MEERDYLMRQFNHFGKAIGKILAEILKLKGAGNTLDTIEYANEQLRTALNIDIEDVIEIPTEDFINKFINDFDVDYEGFEDLADLLYQVGYLFEAQNDQEKAILFFHRAFIVYQYLSNSGDTSSYETHYRINELMDLLNSVD